MRRACKSLDVLLHHANHRCILIKLNTRLLWTLCGQGSVVPYGTSATWGGCWLISRLHVRTRPLSVRHGYAQATISLPNDHIICRLALNQNLFIFVFSSTVQQLIGLFRFRYSTLCLWPGFFSLPCRFSSRFQAQRRLTTIHTRQHLEG